MAESRKPPDEPTYHEYIRPFLEEKFGDDAVTHEAYLPKTGRYCDFLVDTGLVTLAIEVETSSERVCSEAPTQALLYARHDPLYVPVVVYPPDSEIDKSNQNELEMLNDVVPVVPVRYDPDAAPAVADP